MHIPYSRGGEGGLDQHSGKEVKGEQMFRKCCLKVDTVLLQKQVGFFMKMPFPILELLFEKYSKEILAFLHC